MDSKGKQAIPGAGELMKEIGRQAKIKGDLANVLSYHIGVFDHSEMDIADVARYGIKKLGIACKSGEEIPTLHGYLLARKAPTPVSVMDAKITGNSELLKYINEE
jgi:hypothetical protein